MAFFSSHPGSPYNGLDRGIQLAARGLRLHLMSSIRIRVLIDRLKELYSYKAT